MSEVYPARDPLIVLCDPPENCFNYVKEQRQGGSEVVFWLGIRKKVLRRWCQLKKETPGLKYVDMVNGNIPGNAFKIDPESKRVEKRLTYHCSQASSAKGVDPFPKGLRMKKKLSRSQFLKVMSFRWKSGKQVLA